MNYSLEIKDYRKKNALSQKDFAQLIGVKYNTIYRWEKGLFEPGNKYKKKLNSILGETLFERKTKYIKSPLNYTGNKYRILSQILPEFPKRINVFVDMFCGGATVGANVNANKIYFIDNNERVISLLKFIAKSNFQNLVSNLERLIVKYNLSYSNLNGYAHYFKMATPKNKNNGLKKYNKVGFEKLKADYNGLESKNSDEANLMLYLLLVYGFNNDLRFNSKGEFNLPCGKTDLNKNNLNKLYDFILKAQEKEFVFICGDFRDPKIQEICFNEADYLYLDPPYLITDAVYNETSKWNLNTEKELISFLEKAIKNHLPFCLSNVLSKNGDSCVNIPLREFIMSHNNLKVKNINYHYRSSSYNKKNRDANEKEIIVIND